MERNSQSSDDKQKQQNSNSTLLNAKVDLKFKPIQEQIQEDAEKKRISLEEQKQEIMAELGIDEKLLNLLIPTDAGNDDEFDYFQYFGAKRLQSTTSSKNQDKLDLEKFKSARANLVIKVEDKKPAIYLAKEPEKSEIKTTINAVKVKAARKETQYTEDNQKRNEKLQEKKLSIIQGYSSSSDEDDECKEKPLEKKTKKE